ncbi:MAG: M12 family metallo-peptidase, partial [Chloroflexi bacterium]|nr:M12 family metallo-peptidase [Chloroflexota bacterium]
MGRNPIPAGIAAMVLAAAAGAAPAPLAMPSPVEVAAREAPAYATPIRLDPAAYPGLRNAGRVVFQGFPLDRERRVDLDLERFEVLTEDAIILAGDAPMPRPDVVLLRGRVAGIPGSTVFLSLSPRGTNGMIEAGGDRWILSSGPHGRGVSPLIYSPRDLPDGAIPIRPLSCATEELAHAALPAGGPAGGASCGGAEIAVETNWEFTAELFGGDTVASAEYIVTLFGAVSEIYFNDVGTVLQVGFLRVWPNADDIWDEGSVLTLLDDFQAYWIENMGHVERHLAHFLAPTVEPGAGGVAASLGGVCDPAEGYAVSGYLDGFVWPYPLEDNNPQNWDVVVVAHEIGHNFDAPHTHSMVPPVDQCAYGGCEGADQGTIMSYCHSCPGGIANIVLHFHQRTIDEHILPYLAGLECDLTFFGPQITQQPADAEACVGADAIFSVLLGGTGPGTYQWRKDGTDIPGAVESSYTIAGVTLDHAGVYDVVITSDCGDITSLPAT